MKLPLLSYVRSVSLLACAACHVTLAVSASPAAADSYPERPVRFIVPAAPGGTTDTLARLFGDRMSAKFRQQVVVDNRASASGVLAAELVANAAPDGYTIFLPYHQHTVNAALLGNLPYHPVHSFTPVTQLSAAGLLLVVHPSAPVGNMKEFLDWTKGFKDALNFGSAGIGSGGHLAGELFKVLTGVKAQHIPYKGTGPALQGLLGQEYHYNFTGMLAGSKLAKAGRVKAIAVTTPERVPSIPDVPTVSESGLPGFEVVGWYGVLAPAKLPSPLLRQLHRVLLDVLQEPQMQKTILASGGKPVGNTPEVFRKYLLADMAKWQKVVKASRAQAF